MGSTSSSSEVDGDEVDGGEVEGLDKVDGGHEGVEGGQEGAALS